MIDRVFVFSKDFAKKNGNGSKLRIIVLLTVVLMFSMIILEDKQIAYGDCAAVQCALNQ